MSAIPLRARVLGVAALLLAVAALWPSRREGVVTTDFRLPAWREIVGVRIEPPGDAAGALPIVLARQGDGRWTADGAPANPDAIEKLAAGLRVPIEMDKVDAVNRADWSRYGVHEGAARVVLIPSPNATSREISLRIGQVIEGRTTFIRVEPDDAQVLRARADLRSLFEAPPGGWRRSRAVPFDAPDIARITRLVGPSGDAAQWRLERNQVDARWRLTPDEPLGLDQVAIDSITTAVATARFVRWDGPASDALRPAARLVIETFGGERHTLAHGERNPDGSAWAVSTDLPAPGLLPNHIMTFLDLPLDGLLDRRLFHEEVARVVRMEIHFAPARQPGAWGAERSDAGGWRVLGAGLDGEGPESAKIARHLAAVLGARAAAAVRRPPDDAWRISEPLLTLTLDDQRRISVSLGAPIGPAARYARVEVEPRQPDGDPPPRTYVLSAHLIEQIRADPQALPGP